MSDEISDLRLRAEEMLRKQLEALDKIPPADVQRLVHELRIHQIELEMQNDELRRTQQELEASREKYFDLYDLAPVGYVSINENGIILESNLTAASMLSQERSYLVGQPFTRLIFREDQNIYYRCHKQLVETREDHICRIRMVKKDGNPLWVRINISIAQGIDGSTRFRAVIIDISERKQVDEKLSQVMEELTRSNEELEKFAYVASHDLQEPLRMVSSFARLLENRYKGKLDQDADDFINFAVDGANRMQVLITDLLAYSRVGRWGNEFKEESSDAVLERALSNLKVVVEQRGAVVTRDPLPVMMGDDSQLAQLFQNLIGNAVKFCKDRTPHIHVSSERRGNKWVFSIRDNGIGIAPEYFERIFLIFQRLHGKQEYPGTGIGLAICRKVAERHGGRIWVESEPGSGSTFYFTIPMEREIKP
jgi:chemotaxis family two-component system sensor kinase Cph1